MISMNLDLYAYGLFVYVLYFLFRLGVSYGLKELEFFEDVDEKRSFNRCLCGFDKLICFMVDCFSAIFFDLIKRSFDTSLFI